MVSFDWQNLAVLAIVLAAAGYLARTAWRSVARRKASACGACGDCSRPGGGRQLVTIESLARSPSDGTTGPPSGGAV